MPYPKKQGLYDPAFERDSCGVGFLAHIKGEKSRSIVEDAFTMLMNLSHRGARGAEENTGDGAGMLLAQPHWPVSATNHGWYTIISSNFSLRLRTRR